MANGNSFSHNFALNTAKCPECGGQLQIPDNAEWITCPFCDTAVHVAYPSQQQTNVEPDGTIRDRTTGYGLFRVHATSGFSVSGTSLQRTGSSSRPYVPHVELRDRAGGVVSLCLGSAGTRQSAGMKALVGMYGAHLAGVDTTNYADMPDPLMLADMTAADIAASRHAANLRFSKQLACPNLEQRRQAGFARIQRIAQAQGGMVSSPFIAVVLRTYEFSHNGQPWKMACFVELSAAKDGSGIGEGVAEGIGGIVNSIGSSLGGLFGGGIEGSGFSNPFGGQQASNAKQTAPQGGHGSSAMDFFMGGGLLGKMRREHAVQAKQAQQEYQPSVAQPFQQMQQVQSGFPGASSPMGQASDMPTQAQAQQALSQGVLWCVPDFSAYVSGGTIYWYVQALATFVAPATDYDERFEREFLPLVSTFETHPDVENLSLQVAQQEAARIQGATQTQLAQNQATFQAQQAAHRQQQAAFDSYNQSISAARDARHQQFMSSSNQQFEHHAPDFSEAIRGVNMYTTSDGREVELSTHADHAWENQAGDVIGTSNGFEPGAGWTEIPRT